MKKLLSILLSACVILSGAIITSSALEDSGIKQNDPVVVSPQASPDEASELETVQALIKDKHGYDHVISIGRVGDYGIYYNIPELLLEYNLEYFYGNYHFFGGGQTGRNIPADFGVFVYGKGKLYDIGEAYDNKDIDFDSVVSLIRTYKEEHKDVWVSFTIQDYVPETDPEPVTEPIFTPYENFVFEMNNRYGNHFDNFVLVGYMNRYSVYYSNPVNRATCAWEWESTYGKYKFVVHGGQTGNYEPEDLGVFVFDRDNHLLYNLQEAYDNKDIDFDMVVSEIRNAQKSMDMCFTFSIEDVESNPTVPQPTKPNVTDPTSAVTDETAQPTAAPTISKTKVKKANTIEVKVKSINVKSKKLRKNKLTVKAIFVKNAQGKLSFKKLSGSKKLSVTPKGKITVKKWKKAKKGIYKIKVRVTAAGTPRFRKASKLVTVKIKIK